MTRYYSSNARETSLTGSISNSATSISVDTPVGYPSQVPFEIHCELGTSNEEIMLVTFVAGSTWTVTRGFDGSSALAHDVGAKIVHGVSAVDFTDTQTHIGGTTGVHGLTPGSALVGTTDSQTLTNKTLTSPVLNTPAISGGTVTGITSTNGTFNNPTLTSPNIGATEWADATHTHTSNDTGGVLSGGNLPRLAFTSNSTLTTGSTFVFWDASPLYNVGPIWSSSNKDRLTAPLNGLYLFSTEIQIAGTGSTPSADLQGFSIRLLLYSSGGSSSGLPFYEHSYVNGTTTAPRASTSGMFYMTAGQFVRVIGTQSWGAGIPDLTGNHLQVKCLEAF